MEAFFLTPFKRNINIPPSLVCLYHVALLRVYLRKELKMKRTLLSLAGISALMGSTMNNLFAKSPNAFHNKKYVKTKPIHNENNIYRGAVGLRNRVMGKHWVKAL